MKIEWHKVTWYSWTLTALIFLVLVPLLVYYFIGQYREVAALDADTVMVGAKPVPRSELISTVKASYSCDAGKTIRAVYHNDNTPQTIKLGAMPLPHGSIDLVLSDGRTMTLPHGISADGARYATGDESLIFWSKGNGSFIEEKGKGLTYSNCSTN